MWFQGLSVTWAVAMLYKAQETGSSLMGYYRLLGLMLELCFAGFSSQAPVDDINSWDNTKATNS